jgi:putative membrane protein
MSERAARLAIGAVSAAVLLAVGALMLGQAPGAGAPGPAVSALPGLNAALNGTSALLLVTGYVLIRRRRVAAHRACMVTAFGVSTLFLLSYVAYHAQAGSVRFTGQGPLRAVYFLLLVTHIVLAAAIVPLAVTTLYRAWSGQLARHRRIARWTLPIWLYVSVTGVIVYWMLYHL